MPLQIEIKATAQQIAQFEAQCAVSEYLLAGTLARRVEGLRPEQAEPFIRDWFRSVRMISVANHISSGITVVTTGTL